MLSILIFITLLYLACVASYVLWLHLDKKEKSLKSDEEPSSESSSEKTEGIIGKSKFRLPKISPTVPLEVKSEPLGATEDKTEKEEKEPDTFTESKPTEEESEVQQESENPEGYADGYSEEENLLPIDEPLEVEPDTEEEETEEEDESEEVPGLGGAALAGGLTFEAMSGAVKAVVHRAESTEEECRKAGKTLFDLEQTAFFEKLAESGPDRRDVVAELMDLHLNHYAKSITEEIKSNRNSVDIPVDFDINDLVEQLKE